ncbi:hypothetical protein PG985_001891 [Apiospora marii]|uniref:Uncharacterized protein n=1 Tax=Apiospora marii TaxID=335849 RepID=A0ABR1RZT5_9PEZI
MGKNSASDQGKRTGSKKKQSSKRSTSSSMIVNTSPTTSKLSLPDEQGNIDNKRADERDESSSHDTQYYLQGMGSQFDDQDTAGR